jgi:hypothetical protein
MVQMIHDVEDGARDFSHANLEELASAATVTSR